jgi:hypothetical protein
VATSTSQALILSAFGSSRWDGVLRPHCTVPRRERCLPTLPSGEVVPFSAAWCLYKGMHETPDPTTLHVVPISAQADDRWRLSDRYVEEVWPEHLGPTATLLARRLGRMIDEHPSGVDIDLADLAVGVGVQRGIAVKALERLNRFKVVHFAAEQSIVGVSGFAPSVQGGRLLRLSERGRRAHDRLVAVSEVARPVPPAPAVRAAVRASGGSGPGSRAVRAGRVWSGRRAGRSASPDRVSSEVGSGRSCVRVVGGHGQVLDASARDT